jgi:hypothetical protein
VADVREAPCPKFSIGAINVGDRRFRTNEGLGVGSTLGELRKAYHAEILSGEGATYALVREIGVGFGLSGSSSSPSDTATVVAVRVGPDRQSEGLAKSLSKHNISYQTL